MGAQVMLCREICHSSKPVINVMLASAVRRAMVSRASSFAQRVQKPVFAIRQHTAISANPETPLMHYKATQQATSSINHRIFYVNVIAMVFVIDAGSAVLDM